MDFSVAVSCACYEIHSTNVLIAVRALRFPGYMDGAVQSGERAAHEVALALKAAGKLSGLVIAPADPEPENAKVCRLLM